MVKSMKLRGTVSLEADRSLKFNGQLYDGTPFFVQVDQFDVQLTEEFRPSRTTVMGFLFVQQEAQQGDVCYLTLPKPSLVHGRQVSVKEVQLMPRVVSLKDFNPSKTTKKKTKKEASQEKKS